MFDEHDVDVPVAKLLSFTKHRPMLVAKMPGTYAVEETTRNKRARTKKAGDWLDSLKSGGFNTEDEMLELLIQRRLKNGIPKKYIIKTWNAHHRFDVETTLACCKFAGINLKQLRRVAMFIACDTRDPGSNGRGLRPFAPTKECYKRKRDAVIAKYPTMTYKKVPLLEKDADELKELVYKLCKDDCPISGWKPKLTRSMKAHLLFGGHLVRQLRLWGTLGGIDEQNIESAHAIWNKLLRQFGVTRGTELQKKVLREYLFQTDDFMHLIIARVKEEGKRNLKSGGNDTNELPRARPAQRRIVGDELDIEGLQNDSLEIGPLAVNINNEVALHQELVVEEPMDGEIEASNKVTSDDTMICRCKIVGCEKLRLKLAFDVHKYESHQMIKS